jgi:hypothetical protein
MCTLVQLRQLTDADPKNKSYSLLLAVADNNHVRYFATFCIVSGTYTMIGLIIAWCEHHCRVTVIAI